MARSRRSMTIGRDAISNIVIALAQLTRSVFPCIDSYRSSSLNEALEVDSDGGSNSSG